MRPSPPSGDSVKIILKFALCLFETVNKDVCTFMSFVVINTYHYCLVLLLQQLPPLTMLTAMDHNTAELSRQQSVEVAHTHTHTHT